MIRARSSDRTPAGSSQSRGFFDVADDDLLDPERAAGMPGRAVAVIEQQLGDAGADGAESDDADLGFFHARKDAREIGIVGERNLDVTNRSIVERRNDESSRSDGGYDLDHLPTRR